MASDEYPCAECGRETRAPAAFCRYCGAPHGARQMAVYAEYRRAPESAARRGKTRRNGRRTVIAPAAQIPWLVALAAVAAVLAIALAGWRASWPRAIFGVQKASLDSPPAPSGAPPATAPAAPAGAFPVTPNPADPAAGADPAAVVAAYFSAINARDYRAAWELGGKSTGSSYPEFVQGFSGTARDTVTILALDKNDVTARLVAEQDNGTSRAFQGIYTVTSGTITRFDVYSLGPPAP